jgi:hypothetical protein
MYKSTCVLVLLLGHVMLAAVARGHEFSFEGSVSLGDGVVAEGAWSTGPTTLSWSVEHGFGECVSYYTYNYEHPATDSVQFILEAHENMDMGDLLDINSTLTNFEIGTFEPASYPGLPEAVYGYRFWGETDRTAETISFFSYFPPMWGDFHSHGTDPQDHARNGGFTVPDTGPERMHFITSDGSLSDHVLAPGGDGEEFIPEPSSFGLVALGCFGLAVRRRRRSRAA